MTEATVMQTDLDRLADRIEKAAGIIQDLRGARDRALGETDELRQRVRAMEEQLRGQNPAELMGELQTLRKEQKEWQTERREVAGKIEALVKKLDKIDG
jgi:predicted  nucleic acid-binding Zn-ribbon protein